MELAEEVEATGKDISIGSISCCLGSTYPAERLIEVKGGPRRVFFLEVNNMILQKPEPIQ